MDEGKIRALFIFEMMGRPPEHIKNALEGFVKKLGEQKGVEIVKQTINEPRPLEKEGVEDLYTTFAEVELETDTLGIIFDITVHMLPAHVEILGPEELILKNFELSSTLSALTIRLHKYDEIAKAALMDRNILMQRLQEMQQLLNEKGIKPKTKKSEKKLSSKKKQAKKSVKKVVKKK